MCIVFWHVAEEKDERYSLVVASNRDEFLARPTTEASWHDWTAPTSANAASSAEKRVLSGLDLTAGGTWFGVSLPPPGENGKDSTRRPGLRFATLTNFTESIPPAARPSRGKLVRDFLDLDLKPPLETSAADHAAAQDALEEYLVAVEAVKQDYAGFNLLVGEISSPSPSSSSKSSAASSTPSSSSPVRLAYISNRESSTKRARILDPETSAREGKSVRGLSNSTLEVEVGEQEWPKVKSGALAVEQVLERVKKMSGDGEAVEKSLAEGLYDALSTPHPSPIEHRTHLRHTVLVRPLCLDPSAPLPAVAPPLPPAADLTTHSFTANRPSDPSMLPETVIAGPREGENGVHWYGTRVQTLLLAGRNGKVVLRERDVYVLGKDGRPRWSGEERRFEFRI